MKPSDILQDLGRPVAYYPGLRKITGSTTATILLCQLLYWNGKEKDKDGWIYKRAEINDKDEQNIEDETGLSYHEQVTARKLLKLKGILEEKSQRLEHRLYFRINLQKLNELWETVVSRNAESAFGETRKARLADDVNRVSLIGTTENTTQNKNTEHTTASAEERGAFSLKDEKAEQEQGPKEETIKAVEEEFANHAGLTDIPSKSDPRYPDWRKSYKVLAGICERTQIHPAYLAVGCAMKRDELEFSAGRPGAFIKTAENIAAAFNDEAQREGILRQINYYINYEQTSDIYGQSSVSSEYKQDKYYPNVGVGV